MTHLVLLIPSRVEKEKGGYLFTLGINVSVVFRPGKSTADLTPLEIRNRNIARIFREAGFMEELGSGISRMIREMENIGNPRPGFIEKGAFFCVTLRIKSPIPAHLENMYQLLKSKEQLSSSEISTELKVHQNTAINRLHELINLDIIEKIGSGKNIKYRIL